MGKWVQKSIWQGGGEYFGEAQSAKRIAYAARKARKARKGRKRKCKIICYLSSDFSAPWCLVRTPRPSFRNPPEVDIRNLEITMPCWIPDLDFVSSGMTLQSVSMFSHMKMMTQGIFT
jgi:hypothetical protein